MANSDQILGVLDESNLADLVAESVDGSEGQHPIDEIPLFSNYSPCFHKIGYIQKIVYEKINYLVKSMIAKSVYFHRIGRFFQDRGVVVW